MLKKKRIEFDILGVKKIDYKRLWGAQTQRSIENFKIGRDKIPFEIIIALGKQKKACALANNKLGLLNTKLTKAIIKACDQIINLNLIDEFPLSVWQTGSGTQTLKDYKNKDFYRKGNDKLIRNYGIGAQIIKDLKIKNMTLITKSPKKVIGLDGYGIKITKQEII